MPETESTVVGRRPARFRRRLRSRIILSFVLLGFGLTALFAFATNWTRGRVENEIVEDVMNRNIDEYARQYYAQPNNKPEFGVQQMLGRVIGKDRFEELRNDQPDWYKLPDGIHSVQGTNADGTPFAYKLAVRKTSNEWFFLAYDMTQARQSETQFNRAIYISVIFFTALSLLVGWWAASRVMSPVSELAARLRSYRGSSDPKPLAPHFPEDEVGELAKALDDYSARLTEVVQRDREFNADVSHELRTPLAVIRGAACAIHG